MAAASALGALSDEFRRAGLPYHSFGRDPTMAPGLSARAYIAAALPYPLNEPLPSGREPRGLVASFAARHWYRGLACRLMSARDAIIRSAGGAEGWDKAGLRILVNSRVPEKPLAAAAGLGLPGRHSLIIHPELGPAIVIGVMLLPRAPDGAPAASDLGSPSLSPDCAGCSACLRACPTSAIMAEGGIIKERCLQWWASKAEALPEWMLPLWGRRIWGCDECIRACMRSRGRTPQPSIHAFPSEDGIGAEPPLLPFLLWDDERLAAWLRGTAMGMKWVPLAALRRNALLALGSCRTVDESLIAELMKQEKSDHPALSQAAGWSLARLNGRTDGGN